ncbi:CPBP family intramembrane metalloprotease [Mucilaginibacter terrenus]|uniref:CPBP family intramembrane metalloprotease n=1 Tax=Mucilaginibacter terrenus TaxID=2482727 RepID=A0A3E2NQF9_9SPHI|nr:type II CAAX endopeptidase family protein [Mucilaginibacter terrenus]RFZ83229.1 CPBP family intramembrane metalloprotease [Mucilaginibacter terrenus]
MKSAINKYPVAAFVVLTFAISYLVGLPLKLYVLNKALEGSEIGLNYLSKIFVVFAPALAAVIVTSADNENGELRALLKKVLPDTEHIIWWLALLSGGFVVTMISFIIAGSSFPSIIVLITASSPLLLVLHLLGAVLLIGIGEELGWRGWLLPRLIKDSTPAKATLIVFAIWAIWHLPVLLSGYRVVIPFLMACLALSIILTRFWHHVNGNVFVLAVAHAAVNFPEAFFEGRLGTGQEHDILNAWTAASAIYLLMAIAVIIYDPKWWINPYKPAPKEIEIPMEDRPGLDL